MSCAVEPLHARTTEAATQRPDRDVQHFGARGLHPRSAIVREALVNSANDGETALEEVTTLTRRRERCRVQK